MLLLIESLDKLKDFMPLDSLTQQAQAVLRVLLLDWFILEFSVDRWSRVEALRSRSHGIKLQGAHRNETQFRLDLFGERNCGLVEMGYKILPKLSHKI